MRNKMRNKMKIINGDLILKKNTTIDDNVKVVFTRLDEIVTSPGTATLSNELPAIELIDVNPVCPFPTAYKTNEEGIFWFEVWCASMMTLFPLLASSPYWWYIKPIKNPIKGKE